MLSNFIRARYHWERGESELALGLLHQLLAGDEQTPAFYLTPAEVERDLPLPFEIVVTNILLTDEVLSMPFAVAFTRLWQALPAQFLITILAQRSLNLERDAAVFDLLRQAAGKGLISSSPGDYDLSGKAVLDPNAFPEIVEFLGGSTFLESVAAAQVENKWQREVAANGTLVGNLFLYAVFHRERFATGEMVLTRLEEIAASHVALLDAIERHIGDWFGNAELSGLLVSVGMRIEQAANPQQCLREFAEALSRREFEPFVRRYYGLDRAA